MKKVQNGREAIEAKENLPFNKVDAPTERFQQEQQVATMKSAENSVETEGFIPKKTKSSGHTLRQEAAAQVIMGKGAPAPGVASPATFGLKEISFSGDTGTIVGSASGTPTMGSSYQGNTRVDKRLSDANKDINFNASEQVVNEYDNIPALAESKSTVGYNGNPKNMAARSQKKAGLTSAEILYDRSLDIIGKDTAVFVTGQVVKQKGVEDGFYPTRTIDVDPKSDDYGTVIDFADDKAPSRGNYMPRAIKVTFAKSGGASYVAGFEVEEDDISCDQETDVVVNAAGTNHKIDMNRAELARQLIDAEAGSPTSEHFNPLGRSVDQPTATVGYLQDLENATGATLFAAYKFANKARGYYLNRTSKDGQLQTEPAVDALYGHLYPANDYKELITAIGGLDSNSPLFSKAANAKGSAATLIYAFDSPSKYKTKGDLVNQPRGLKMHIQTADNNINPFRCKDEFVAALNSIDAFSTIDHEYDPLSPVYVTDNVRLIYPYSLRKALQFTRSAPNVKTYQSQVPAYFYAAGSGNNSFIVNMADPVLNGVAYFLDQHATAIHNAIEGDELIIPTVHSTTHFSLWDLLICAATPFIIYERTNTMKDLLDFEMFYKYPLQGNILIKDAQPTDAVNYGNPSTTTPLVVKQMLPSSAIRWKYPEMMTAVTAGLLMPYYFNERNFEFTDTGKASKLKPDGSHDFTTPVVRSGMKLAGLDDFFGMEVKDQLLVADPMVRLPFNVEGDEFQGCIYKYSQDSDGLVVARANALAGKSALDWMKTPRLLGWYFDLPGRLGMVTGPTDSRIPAANTISLVDLKTSYYAIQYKGGDVITADNEVNHILDKGAVAVNRAQSFRQHWYRAVALSSNTRSRGFDLILSMGDCFKNVVEGGVRGFTSLDNKTQFMPFMFGPYSVVDGKVTNAAHEVYASGENDKPALLSIHRALWTLMQKTCFVISPFDNIGDTVYVDPFSLSYVFGLAGFMAANYDEELYNRANEVQNQGYGYTSDPMATASPVLKDAYRYTQIG